MESLIRLYNTALAQLGGEQIPLNISPLEDNALGAICQNAFPHALDSALEAHEWSFARKRAVLALLPGDKPGSEGYRFRYAMPSDCIRPINIASPGWGAAGFSAGRSPAYALEGQALLCSVPEAELLYVARVSEPKRWPAYFAEALKWKMAAELASAHKNDLQEKQRCEQMYEYHLARACAMDRGGENPARRLTPWQAARGNHFRGGF